MANPLRLASESIAGQRPYQEDSVFLGSLSDGRVLVAIADGMGGHAAGDVASQLALESLVTSLEEGKELDRAFVRANTRVHEEAREPDKKGMGTTLVAVLVDDGEYFMANVGDSRGYLITGDGIRQITQDHSFVAEAVKSGHQTLEQAMAHPWRDALTRSVGTEASVDVDFFGPFPVRPDTALLVCSDGLYKSLPDEELHRLFLGSSDADSAAALLVQEALERGSDDNISVALLEYGDVPRGEEVELSGSPAETAPVDPRSPDVSVVKSEQPRVEQTVLPAHRPPSRGFVADKTVPVPWLGITISVLLLVVVGAAAVLAALAL